MTDSVNNKKALLSITDCINKFSSKFYKTLAENENGNVICSPISVSMVLSMITFGSRNATERELRSGLCLLENNDDDIKSGIQSLIDILNSVKSSELRFANKIFPSAKFEMTPEFKMIMETTFRSTIQNINFANVTAACATINSWCEIQTNNRITDIVNSSNIEPDTQLVLANAVYFKGVWKKKFQAQRTSPEPFYLDKNTRKNVPMMQNTGYYNYDKIQDLDAHYIELPYKSDSADDAISMFIILPDAINGLKEIEQHLDKINFKQLHDNARSWSCKNINLLLPKFKFDSTFDLTGTLIQMGMESMFTVFADFGGMTGGVPLKVDSVLQKAFIEVNEEGTEAAAVTVTVVGFGCAMPAQPIRVAVNRPFYCAIVATNTGTQLFNARIIDPSAT